ncbi:MAG: hypothetical protein A3D39_05395 [Candidatus Buchananbacteria bacterium RIFCSPHIGHO2_02_FULL_39_17]|nr:MAG: hypothetical protein A3D39_05395 [Candidatus Buchananbacteria bacterium RIFCSPHIGHO2_02_FULL_39_17]
MNESNLKNKRILIFQQRNWGINIGQYLAEKLQIEGCHLAALTFKRSTHDYILNQTEVKYDLILSNDDIVDKPKEFLGNDDYSLEDICQALSINSVWPLVMSLRNHIRSYGDKYYYSFRQNVSDEVIIEYVKAVYKCVRKVFSEFKPDLIIAPNFVSFMHLMFNLYAQSQGIKMLAVTDCKVEDRRIFTYSYRDDQGPFIERVDQLNSGQIKSDNIESAKKFISEFRQNFKKPQSIRELEVKKTLVKKIRHLLSPYYQILRWYLKRPVNLVETLKITADYRSPRIILRDHYSHDRYKKFAESYNYYPFEKIQKFVYFPLQFQPEASIDVVAPYFSNQIETARLLAMSLPDDYTLVVKEHPTMVGLRPPSYLEKIARTVNVKLIDYRIPSQEVLTKADLIISPNSTTLFEAAFLKKPAIQLGDLGTTLLLPNVFKHTDLTTITGKIKELLILDLNNQGYERKLENYVSAAYDVGFEVDYLGLWQRGAGDKEKLWQIYRQEIKRVFEK